jgi:hypothetical protein
MSALTASSPFMVLGSGEQIARIDSRPLTQRRFVHLGCWHQNDE